MVSLQVARIYHPWWCGLNRMWGIGQQSGRGTDRDQCSYLVHGKTLPSLGCNAWWQHFGPKGLVQSGHPSEVQVHGSRWSHWQLCKRCRGTRTLTVAHQYTIEWVLQLLFRCSTKALCHSGWVLPCRQCSEGGGDTYHRWICYHPLGVIAGMSDGQQLLSKSKGHWHGSMV